MTLQNVRIVYLARLYFQQSRGFIISDGILPYLLLFAAV